MDGLATARTVLHELQHAVGYVEGTSRGTSLEAEIRRSTAECSQHEKDARRLPERARNTRRIEEREIKKGLAYHLLTPITLQPR